MNPTKFLFKFVIYLAVSAVVFADDWPQWRGMNRDGISRETNLLKEWPEEGPKLIWSFEGLGAGYSSVAVSKNVIFTTGEIDANKAVFALDLNGKLIWQSHGLSDVASYCSPILVERGGKNIIVTMLSENFVGIDASNGKTLWSDV